MLLLISFAFGTFIGSFLNVCIHRLPRNESVVKPPSRCYSCGTHVQWYDNLPIISYLVLMGRCRWCKSPFSPRYLIMEVVVGLLTMLMAWWAFDPAHDAYSGSYWILSFLRAHSHPAGATALCDDIIIRGFATCAVVALAYFLFVSAVIDFDHTIIPDELTKSFQLGAPVLAMLCGLNISFGEPIGASTIVRVDPGNVVHFNHAAYLEMLLGISIPVLLCLALSLPLAHVIYSRYCPASQRWTAEDTRGFDIGVWWFCAVTMLWVVALALMSVLPNERWGILALIQGDQAIFGSLVGWCSLYVVGLLGTIVFKRNAMGFGDVKFLAPVGAFLGPIGVLYAFFAAAIVGTLIGLPMRLANQRREIPFVPYLAVGTLLTLLWGPPFHRWLFAHLLHG